MSNSECREDMADLNPVSITNQKLLPMRHFVCRPSSDAHSVCLYKGCLLFQTERNEVPELTNSKEPLDKDEALKAYHGETEAKR